MGVSRTHLVGVADHLHNAFTLVDLSQEDQPLVYVNQAFSKLTGYPFNEIIGRNCRFLQGEHTEKSDVMRIRKAIFDRIAIFCDLLNYRKDGTAFYNRLVLLPIEVDQREHYLGMQIDATPLLAKVLGTGKKFNDIKTSDAIRDKINTPLMTILNALASEVESETSKMAANRAFTQILETVKALPFKD